jgi:hypothetical protein
MSVVEPLDSAPNTAPSAALPVSAGLTFRAVAIGATLCILLTLWTIHSAYVTHSSFITIAHLPIAALCPLVIVVLILNPILKSIMPGRSLTRQEIIIIFFLVFTASAIPGWAFSTYALSVISGPHYFASEENRWVELFFEYLPAWLIVPDQNGAVSSFFEGLPSSQIVPWRFWLVPMFWWGTFYVAMFFVGASIMVILRKQWVDHERLAFPLAQVPLMLIDGTDDPEHMPAIARHRLFWTGFGITISMLVWNMVAYFDVWPSLPIGNQAVTSLTFFESFPPVNLKFNLLLAGVAYFTRVEVLLSVWFFYLIRVIEQGLLNRVGMVNARAVVNLQHFGGFIVFVLFTLWMARAHLYQVWQKFLGNAPELDDSREFFSYRKAVFALLFGLFYMMAWLYASGMSLPVVVLFLGLLVLVYLGVTRVVAETGLVSLDLPHNDVNTVTLRLVGTDNLSTQNLTSLTLANAFGRNWRTLGMCSMAHTAKVGDDMGGVGRGVFVTIALTLTLTFLTAVSYTLYLGYSGGAFEFTEPAFVAGARGVWSGLISSIRNVKILTGLERMSFGVGALVSFLLVLAHHRLYWWPLHPVGFGIALTVSVNNGIFSILMVWLIKTILLRLGGVSLYRKGQPFVIGMLSAYALGVLLSFLVDLVWFPGNGHAIHGW